MSASLLVVYWVQGTTALDLSWKLSIFLMWDKQIDCFHLQNILHVDMVVDKLVTHRDNWWEKHSSFYQVSVRRACFGFSISFNVLGASQCWDFHAFQAGCCHWLAPRSSLATFIISHNSPTQLASAALPWGESHPSDLSLSADIDFRCLLHSWTP